MFFLNNLQSFWGGIFTVPICLVPQNVNDWALPNTYVNYYNYYNYYMYIWSLWKQTVVADFTLSQGHPQEGPFQGWKNWAGWKKAAWLTSLSMRRHGQAHLFPLPKLSA